MAPLHASVTYDIDRPFLSELLLIAFGRPLADPLDLCSPDAPGSWIRAV